MKNKNDLILVGGGGHCKSCIDVIELQDKFNIVGVIDRPEKVGQKILDYTIFDIDENIPDLLSKYNNFLITVGSTGIPRKRIKLYNYISSLGGQFPIIVSPRSHLSKYSKINDGTIIMHDVIVNANSVIGVNCIINNKTIIEHDVNIRDHCNISSNTVINGSVKIGEGNFIGSSVTVKHGISVSPNNVIGMGSIINKNIVKNGTYVGNPARLLKK